MAGLAEAAFAQGLLVCWAAIAVNAIILGVALFRKSRGIAVLVAGLSLLFGATFEPWAAFLASNPTMNPDYDYWLSHYRIMGAAWGGTLMASVILIAVFRPLPKSGRYEESPED